jgi:hypothetical protein
MTVVLNISFSGETCSLGAFITFIFIGPIEVHILPLGVLAGTKWPLHLTYHFLFPSSSYLFNWKYVETYIVYTMILDRVQNKVHILYENSKDINMGDYLHVFSIHATIIYSHDKPYKTSLLYNCFSFLDLTC